MIAAAGLLVAAALTAAPAAAAAPAKAPISMSNAVVTITGKVPTRAGVEILGKARDLTWAACPVDAAAVTARETGIRLVYLDENAFRLATAGLKPSQMAEVMRKRTLENAQYLSDLGDDLATEAGRIGAWMGDSTALSIHRDGYYTGRFILETVEDIEGLIQEWNRVRSLETDLLARADCPPQVAAVLKARERDKDKDRDSGRVMTRLEKVSALMGRDHGKLPLHATGSRVVYARVLPPGISSKLKSQDRDRAISKTGKGYLFPMSRKEMADLPEGARPIIAFLNTAQSERALRMLTTPQMNRLLAAIESRHGAAAQDYLAEILDGRLRMLATLRRFLAGPKVQLAQEGRAELESVYHLVLAEARQAAAGMFGPADAAKGKALLRDLGVRLRVLGMFSATSGDSAMIAWIQRSVAALEARP